MPRSVAGTWTEYSVQKILFVAMVKLGMLKYICTNSNAPDPLLPEIHGTLGDALQNGSNTATTGNETYFAFPPHMNWNCPCWVAGKINILVSTAEGTTGTTIPATVNGIVVAQTRDSGGLAAKYTVWNVITNTAVASNQTWTMAEYVVARDAWQK